MNAKPGLSRAGRGGVPTVALGPQKSGGQGLGFSGFGFRVWALVFRVSGFGFS